MAKKATIMRQGPTKLQWALRIPVMDISIEDTSGWRMKQSSVISQYTAMFPEEYGRTVTSGVSILSRDASGEPLCDQDGKALIDDGKSTVAALQDLYLKWQSVSPQTMSDLGMCPALMDVFQHGLPVTMVLYEDSSPVHRMAWHVGTHDEDANKYLQSSIPQKVALCKSVLEQLGEGKQWADVVKWLTQLYGPRKERDIRRWVLGARVLSEDVLQCLTDRISSAGLNNGITVGYIFGNPYICAAAGESRRMLPSGLKVAALTQLFNKLDSQPGVRITSTSFQTDVCNPLFPAQWLNTCWGFYE